MAVVVGRTRKEVLDGEPYWLSFLGQEEWGGGRKKKKTSSGGLKKPGEDSENPLGREKGAYD